MRRGAVPLTLLQTVDWRRSGEDHRPGETFPVPHLHCRRSTVQVSPTFTTSRSPNAGEFLGAARPGFSPLPWPSLRMKGSALPCSPLGANISTLHRPGTRAAPRVAQKHWLPATRRPDPYHDGPLTGLQTTASRTHQAVVGRPCSIERARILNCQRLCLQ